MSLTPAPIDAEIVNTLDKTSADRLDRRIRLRVGDISDKLASLYSLVAEAKQGGIHVALGFPSWTAYIADVFKDNRVRLKGETRRELVAYLSDEGMSNRAIAGITGLDERTVRRDRAAGAAGASPETVVGLDGKTYRRKRAELPIHPLCKCFPWIPDIELYEMALSIAKIGLLQPLTTYVDGGVEYLLDGKLRREACRMAGVEPVYERYEGDDPAAFVIDMNSRRQHLDDPHLRASLVHECKRECEAMDSVQA